MASFRAYFERHALLTGLVATLVPFCVLVGLQAWWLHDLERASRDAHRANLENCLEAIETEASYFYVALAERMLALPPSLFSQDRLDRAAGFFEKRDGRGARSLFVARFRHDAWGTLLFYDAASGAMVERTPSDETREAVLACAPWKLMSERGVELDQVSPAVDPGSRIVLLPIASDSGNVLGVAGMVLDEDYFRRALLPGLAREALAKYLAEDKEPHGIWVLDGAGREAFGTSHGAHPPEEASRAFSYVFKDWRLAVGKAGMATAGAGHGRLGFNMTVAIAASLALIGGVLVALLAASRELRLSRMKGDFVSNVSHELRTPLASIRVFAELMKLGRVADPAKVREYGAHIESESRRLTQIVNNILDFSRIESGRKSYELRPADLCEVVQGVTDTFAVVAKEKGFAVTLDRPESPVTLPLDAGAVGQALHNLLDNAMKYSDEKRHIEVKLGRENGHAVVAVRDQGRGIPASERERIFDRFHRVSTGLVHDVKGTGLGLAIVKHVVEAHHGSISVESELGRGSTFAIALPIDPPPAVASQGAAYVP